MASTKPAGTQSRASNSRDILICGAGIAGTVLAYRLAQSGFRTMVVERSRSLRSAGNAVDLRGPAVDIVQSMGILPELQSRATQLSDFYRIDATGRRVFTMAPETIGGDLEILRTELNTVLFQAAQDGVEYRFGDSIASLNDRGGHVEVTFDSGIRRDFTLVIGADGAHSRTRAIAFGPESQYVQHLGCYQAHFTTDNLLDLFNAGLLLNRPGRTVGCYTVHRNREIVVGLFFDSPPLDYDRADVAAQKRRVELEFADMGWRTDELLKAMNRCDDFYFDSIAQVSMTDFHRGAVGLVGDAAYGPSLLSGMGATLAITGAAILADEIASQPADYQRAFEQYQARTTDMIVLSHELARTSRGWFIQTEDNGSHAAEAQLSADIESDALREKILKAARTAYPQGWDDVAALLVGSQQRQRDQSWTA